MNHHDPFTLLLIEDSPEYAELVRRIFAVAADPTDVIHANSLGAAAEVLQRSSPSLVLSDFRLPDGSPIDLLSSLGGEPPWPLIVMTAQGDENLAVLSLKSGATEYLVKSPTTLRELPRTVRRVAREWGLRCERRAMQTALCVSEERLRLAMEATSDGLWDWDVGGGKVYWGPRMYTMLGYEPDEFPVTPLRLRSLVHPEDRKDLVRERRWKSLRETGGFTIELRLRTKSGEYKWIVSRGKPVAWSGMGRVTRIVGTHVDIDERHRYETTLQEKSGRLKALFDEANDAIVVAEFETLCIAEVNAMAESLLGLSREQLIGMHVSRLHPADSWEKCGRLLDQAGRLGAKVIFESEVESSDKRRVAVEISASRIHQPGGRLVLQGIYRDLSERRHLEAQLRQAQKMEAIGQLAGGVAHDFNNVLAAIMLQLGLFQADMRLPDELRSTLALLDASTKRAADLTRQLLLFGRRQPAKFQATDIDALLVNLLRMLRRLVGEAIELVFAPKADHHWVLADPGMIEQVVMNMVVNARDAMPQGGRIAIKVGLVEQAAPAEEDESGGVVTDFVCLEITDSGTGIDDGTKSRLFEPFFTTKEVGKGSGLGLATAYSIVKMHKGWIEVESELGRGSSFKVFLPFHNPVRAAIQAGEPPRPAERGQGTVLLVEDDSIVRTFTGLSLRSVGYAVCEASDGVEALRIWETEKTCIDVVLTDMVMPHGLNGWELVEKLRREKPSLAVVLMSGYTTDLPQHTRDPSNRVVFLQKPFDTLKLTQAIRVSLQKVSASRASADE